MPIRAIFLNGINLAWVRYPDFSGEDHMATLPSVCGAEEAMRFLVANGGNALRVWLLQEPSQSLTWSNGLVSGLAPGVLLMAQTMLELALHYGVKVVFVLFNGALVRDSSSCSIFSRQNVLDSLLEHAIRPLARALKGYTSLAMWEVINEGEGLIDTLSASAGGGSCTDVASVHRCALGHRESGWDGFGWNGECRFDVRSVQRVVNRVAGELRRYSQGAQLLTVGSWSFCGSASSVQPISARETVVERMPRRCGRRRRGHSM